MPGKNRLLTIFIFITLAWSSGPFVTAASPVGCLDVENWSSLDVYYRWRGPCAEVIDPSILHRRLEALASERGIVVRRLTKGPAQNKPTPTLLLGCTGGYVGGDHILGVHYGLQRPVLYSVDGTLYEAPMLGTFMSDGFRVSPTAKEPQQSFLSGFERLLRVFFAEYTRANREDGAVAPGPSGVPQESARGLELPADKVGVQLFGPCEELGGSKSLVNQVLEQHELPTAHFSEESPGMTLAEAAQKQPTIALYCHYGEAANGVEEFYRVDVLVGRAVIYRDGDTYRPGVAVTNPKVIVGGTSSDLLGLLAAEAKKKATFESVWSAFLSDVEAVNR